MVLSEMVSALILAVVQGITEWFPVSSSGHLVVFEKLLNYSRGLEFEVALHFGTLMAVFVYFGREITDILREFFSFRFKSENGRLALMLIVASVPAGIVGYLAKDFFDSVLSNLFVVSVGFGITGLLLIIVSVSKNKIDKSDERLSGKFRNNKLIDNKKIINVKSNMIGAHGSKRYDDKTKELSYFKALIIGFAQVFALIPGISRSGATISSGVLFGLSEEKAMKFSFLLAIPVIFGANILSIGNKTLSGDLIWATLLSFLVGLLTIHLVFTKFLVKRKNFVWFGIYALVLAFGLGFWIIGR